MKNGIVVPCYNEANRLKFDEFEAFLNANKHYMICFVNDGSKDDTLGQLKEFQNRMGAQVEVLDLDENKGKAGAVRQGCLYLSDYFNLTTIGYIDADLATGFEDYQRLVQIRQFSNLKLVFGSRKLNPSNEIERSAFRKLASWGIGKLINVIIGMPVKDTQCGAKVFDATVVAQLFAQPFISRWLFDIELFIRLKNTFPNNVMSNIKEVALNAWEEVEGSKITLKDAIQFPLRLIEIGFMYRVSGAMNFETVPSWEPLNEAA